MVDKYKKILAGKDPHAEQFMEEQNFLGNVDEEAADTAGSTETNENAGSDSGRNAGEAGEHAEPTSPEAGQSSPKPTGFMKEHLTLNPSSQQYGNGKAEILDFGVLDKDGRPSNVLLKGEEFSIKERIVFHDDIAAPIFTFTIKDKRGMDLSGTNTLFEGKEIPAVKKGDEYYCTFTQRMNLQGGEYLLSISCTGFEEGEHTVYDRKYDITSITVLSNKNTVGIYDMESEVTLERHEA